MGTLGKDLERKLNKVVTEGLRDVAKDYQRMLDSLGRRYSGRSVATIKPVLQREWKRAGGNITDPELTEYATMISNGTRITMRVQR